MAEQVRYITDEQGQQIGVVLNLQQYQQLRALGTTSQDNEILIGLSDAELQALSESILAPSAQERLDQLLEVNSSHELSEEDSRELDRLLSDIDHLTILKTRARYTLNRQTPIVAAA